MTTYENKEIRYLGIQTSDFDESGTLKEATKLSPGMVAATVLFAPLWIPAVIILVLVDSIKAARKTKYVSK